MYSPPNTNQYAINNSFMMGLFQYYWNPIKINVKNKQEFGRNLIASVKIVHVHNMIAHVHYFSRG